jgi:hypothetical protein
MWSLQVSFIGTLKAGSCGMLNDIKCRRILYNNKYITNPFFQPKNAGPPTNI